MIQDYIHCPGEKALSRFPTSVAYFDNEVYHIITHSHHINDIYNTIKFIPDLPFFAGILSEPSDRGDYGSAGTLTADMIDDVARNTNFVFFGAFDGESYVLWDIRAK
jgi:hypothetical protein